MHAGRGQNPSPSLDESRLITPHIMARVHPLARADARVVHPLARESSLACPMTRSRRAFARSTSRGIREGGFARRARAAAAVTVRAGDDDDDDGGGGMRAHVGPVDVRVKRTTPRDARAVRRTGETTTTTTRSAKELRRARTYAPDAYEYHGFVRVRKEGLGARVNEDASSRFPFGDGFEFETCECETEEMVEATASMASAERRARLENVLANRSFSLMPVLEGIYDIGNMLAVCRTTEALGIGCASIVSSKGLSFKASGRTSGGALKWQHIEQFETSESALRAAKKKGYRILTTEFEGAYPLSHYDWTIPTAVVFGNEREGVSEEAKAMSDGGVFIPMFGFTESLNISVAAALVMSHAVTDRINRQGFHGDLTEEEKRVLRGVYMSRLIPNYAKQGYLEDLVARHRKGKGDAKAVHRNGEDDDVCEEELDEQLLLAELAASNVVGRRLPKKDLGWDKHLDE